jgi:hypothetical protein
MDSQNDGPQSSQNDDSPSYVCSTCDEPQKHFCGCCFTLMLSCCVTSLLKRISDVGVGLSDVNCDGCNGKTQTDSQEVGSSEPEIMSDEPLAQDLLPDEVGWSDQELERPTKKAKCSDPASEQKPSSASASEKPSYTSEQKALRKALALTQTWARKEVGRKLEAQKEAEQLQNDPQTHRAKGLEAYKSKNKVLCIKKNKEKQRKGKQKNK